jgi:hypothetical protein
MATDFASLASGLSSSGDGSAAPPQGDSGTTIQHMVLCDKSVKLLGIKIPALIVAVVGGLLIGMILSYLLTKIFGTGLPTSIDILIGLIRIAGIVLVSYAIQKFGRIRNMYPGMWPCGLKPTQTDPTAQAVNQVLCKLGGIKQAACKLGGLSNLAQSVGGLSVLIKSSGGLACLINEYDTFENFVSAMGGISALQAQLPNSSDIYQAMGGGSCGCSSGSISMPMDGSQ